MMSADSSLILCGSKATSRFPLLHAVVREHRTGAWEEGSKALKPDTQNQSGNSPRAG